MIRFRPLSFLIIPLFLFISHVSAQTGIKGYIFTKEGKPLAFSTVYIQELKTGTVANADGYYEYPLQPGSYNIEFRHLGYQSETKSISVENSFISKEVWLETNTIQLVTVNIVSGEEDPAYAIMRKAIAAARYYRMLVKAFDANVYIKGSGEIKMPKLIYKLVKSKGLDSVEYFVSETVSKIHYEYPSTYHEVVISARSNDNDTGRTAINNYVYSSIYSPVFGEAVSPLSPSAFSFYRFKLVESFIDKEVEIFNIQVIPRSKGAGVFAGNIYIVNNNWNVYSFDMKTWIMGFEMNINQMFAQVNENMWFPITQQYDIKGKVLGIKISYKYLTSMSEYNVEINDSLIFEQLVLIDEKTEKEYAEVLKEERRLKNKIASDTIQQKEEKTKEQKYTLKDFRKEMKEYENEARKEQEEPKIMSDRSLNIDSLAFKQTKFFWDSIRPIPLTEKEKRPGLNKKIDSIAAVRESDTSSKGSGIFGDVIGGLIFGSSIKINKSWNFDYPSPLARLNYNTVEGFNVSMPLKFRYKNMKKNELRFGPQFDYGFTDKHLKVSGEIRYDFKKSFRERNYIRMNGGRAIKQFNSDGPILPIFNSIVSLFWVKNYMKIYQKDFLNIELNRPLTDKVYLKASAEWAEREELFNNTNYIWVKRKEREFSKNAPINIETKTGFAIHKSFTIKATLKYKPFLKYRRYNGEIKPQYTSYPILSLSYTGGLPNVFDSETDFHRLEAGIRHKISGYRNVLDLNFCGGSTISRNKLYFPDFTHFQGNKTLLFVTNPMKSYRLLDYYKFSTSGGYAMGFAQLNMSRFLLSRIFWLNITGVKETLMVNYLFTEHSQPYVELGYGLDNLTRFIKIEVIAAFEDGEYKTFGIRIGLSGLISFE